MPYRDSDTFPRTVCQTRQANRHLSKNPNIGKWIDLKKLHVGYLNAPIAFRSDKERKKAERKGIKTLIDLNRYVNDLKDKARHRADNIKKYGSPIAPESNKKSSTSNSTNASKASATVSGEHLKLSHMDSQESTRKKEESKKIASNRKEEKQQVSNSTASNSTNTSKALAVVPGETRKSNYGTTNSNFLSKHKKAIGLGAVGLVGTALAARKIAALRKQQQKYPGLRGKIQNVINKLKAKLHR